MNDTLRVIISDGTEEACEIPYGYGAILGVGGLFINLGNWGMTGNPF